MRLPVLQGQAPGSLRTALNVNRLLFGPFSRPDFELGDAREGLLIQLASSALTTAIVVLARILGLFVDQLAAILHARHAKPPGTIDALISFQVVSMLVPFTAATHKVQVVAPRTL